MTARLADERGFALIELLVTMVVAGIILFALFGLVDIATRQQSVATDRVDANDRGRAAMDTISAQLRSRVCRSGTEGSLVSASPTELEFYASLGLTTGTAPPATQRPVLQRRRLTFEAIPNSDPNAPLRSNLVERVWIGAGVAPLPAVPETRRRTLVENVGPLTPTTPYFEYTLHGDRATGLPVTEAPLVSPLSVADLAAQTRLDVSIDVRFATHGRVAATNTPLQNRIFDRSPGCYFG